MQTLTSPSQFDLLPHAETVKVALMAELLIPFDSTNDAEIFWKETKTKLFAVAPEDEMSSDSNSLTEILALFEDVESIVHLEDNWYLALVISSQDGGGNYLLFPHGTYANLDTLLTTITQREETMNRKTVTKGKTTEETNTLTILKSATAPKLNPHANGELEYEIAILEGNLAMRICANSTGGFFSSEFILLDVIEACLSVIVETKVDFKSAMLKSAFTQGSSSNNAGFLCACLRAEGLLAASDKSIFLHQFVGDFAKWKKELAKLSKSKK